MLAAQRRQEQHRRVLAGGLEGLADVTPVGVGQPDVHQHHIEVGLGAEQLQRLGAVVRQDDLVAGVAQRLAEHPSDRGVEVFLLFWVVKILSTTVGETAADFLAGNLGLGLNATSLIMAALLGGSLVGQLHARRYVPAAYWLTVVLVSVVGTLVSDNLVDNFGVSLWTTTAVFAAGLALTFMAWWRSEGTLSIHTIVTPRRERFYWLAILFTFALGTSAGDLVSERLALGYLPSAGLFGLMIALVTVAYWRGGLNAVLAFWTAYVLTRPFGASVGDFLTASTADGGLGLGTNGTSALFLAVIIAAVGWFTVNDRRARPALAGT